MTGYTRVKNGLWSKNHANKLGEAWFLFGKYVSYTNAPKSIKDSVKGEVCVIVYPATIQKQLDISAETWRTLNETLVRELYITCEQTGSEVLKICIKKALL